jgi:hypothetical protein
MILDKYVDRSLIYYKISPWVNNEELAWEEAYKYLYEQIVKLLEE